MLSSPSPLLLPSSILPPCSPFLLPPSSSPLFSPSSLSLSLPSSPPFLVFSLFPFPSVLSCFHSQFPPPFRSYYSPKLFHPFFLPSFPPFLRLFGFSPSHPLLTFAAHNSFVLRYSANRGCIDTTTLSVQCETTSIKHGQDGRAQSFPRRRRTVLTLYLFFPHSIGTGHLSHRQVTCCGHVAVSPAHMSPRFTGSCYVTFFSEVFTLPDRPSAAAEFWPATPCARRLLPPAAASGFWPAGSALPPIVYPRRFFLLL